MVEKNGNNDLRVSLTPLKEASKLDVLLISLIALMPYVHFVVSAMMLITVGIAIMIMKKTRQAVLEQKTLTLVAALITLLSAFSSLVSGNVIGLAVTFGIILILICGAYARSVMRAKLTVQVFRIVGCGSIFTLIIVLIQRLAEKNPGYRPTGWQWNANYLGAVAVMSALISVVAFFEDYGCDVTVKSKLEKIFYGIAFLSDLAIILICESRSSLLAIMVCIIVYMLIRKHYILCGLAVVGGIGVWALGMISPELFGWANSLTYVFTQRYDIWMCAFKSFLSGPVEFLIGRGPMTYRFVWQAEGLYGADHAHNILFDTLINVGVVGFVLYLFLIADFVKNMLKQRENHDKCAFTLSLLALTAIFVQGIADVTIMWHQSACLFILMCSVRAAHEK